VRRALISVLAATLLVGCGNERTSRPDIGQIVDPGTFRDLKYADLGISLRTPNRWRTFDADAPPQVATIASGDAQIAIWRYERAEPLPVDRAQLKAARQALVAQVEGRDKTFELTSSRLVIKPGLRGVELIGQGTNQGERRSVRSLHAYANGYEVVIDAFAPPRDFARVDRETFGPVSRSLRLRKPKP
jgi:hypothetical protein